MSWFCRCLSVRTRTTKKCLDFVSPLNSVLNNILSSPKETHGYSKSIEEYKSEKLAAFKNETGYDIHACLYIHAYLRDEGVRGHQNHRGFVRCDYESFSKSFYVQNQFNKILKLLDAMKIFQKQPLRIFMFRNIWKLLIARKITLDLWSRMLNSKINGITTAEYIKISVMVST